MKPVDILGFSICCLYMVVVFLREKIIFELQIGKIFRNGHSIFVLLLQCLLFKLYLCKLCFVSYVEKVKGCKGKCNRG